MAVGAAIEANGGVTTVSMVVTGFLTVSAALRPVPTPVTIILPAAVIVVSASTTIAVTIAITITITIPPGGLRIAAISPGYGIDGFRHFLDAVFDRLDFLHEAFRVGVRLAVGFFLRAFFPSSLALLLLVP